MNYIDIITSVGFPIAVTLWFMFRLEKTLNRVADAIESCPHKK